MVTVQLALAQGQYPEEHELPPPLASPAASTTQSTCTCSSNESWELPGLGNAFEAIMDTTPPDSSPELEQAENAYVDGDIIQPDILATMAHFDEFLEIFNDS